MAPDTSSTPIDGGKHRKVRFDPTINLGHVLTACGYLAVMVAGYFDLRERLATEQVHRQNLSREMAEEKASNREVVRQVREDMREVRQGINELLRK